MKQKCNDFLSNTLIEKLKLSSCYNFEFFENVLENKNEVM